MCTLLSRKMVQQMYFLLWITALTVAVCSVKQLRVSVVPPVHTSVNMHGSDRARQNTDRDKSTVPWQRECILKPAYCMHYPAETT